MRRAELSTAALMVAFSLFLMWKSTELPIGWVPEEGPGGGWFPFWLGAGMAVCAAVIFVRGWLGRTPEGRSEQTFMDRPAFKLFIVAAGSIIAMVALIHVIGVYFSVPLFLIFYIRFFGRHGWGVTLSLAIATPIAAFLLFEIGLKILLPKGYTEPLFYPLYEALL